MGAYSTNLIVMTSHTPLFLFWPKYMHGVGSKKRVVYDGEDIGMWVKIHCLSVTFCNQEEGGFGDAHAFVHGC